MSTLIAVAPALVVTVETFSPEQAQMDLENRAPNRAIKPSQVAMTRRSLLQGTWEVNGDTIKYRASDGKLFDGQNRLKGCVDAGVPMTTLVVRNVPDRCMSTFDCHFPRSVADWFSLNDYAHSAIMAATLRKMIMFATGSTPPKMGAPEMDIIARQHDVAMSIRKGGNAASKRLIPQSTLAAIHYIGSKIQGAPDAADKFLDVIRTGIRTYAGDPAFVLREYLISQRALRTGERMTDMVRNRIVACSWEAYRQDAHWKAIPRPVTALPLQLEGWTPALCLGKRLVTPYDSSRKAARRSADKLPTVPADTRPDADLLTNPGSLFKKPRKKFVVERVVRRKPVMEQNGVAARV
jgi:hypothetical protein